MSEERKKVWIHAFQTKMLIRIGVYWLIYLVTLWNLLFVWRLLQEGPGNILEQYGRFLQDYYPPLILFLSCCRSLLGTRSNSLTGSWGHSSASAVAFKDLAAGQPIHPIKLARRRLFARIAR